MENNTYKVFQLMEYFITNFDYVSFRVQGLDKENEILIASKTNPNYQIIRITTASVESSFYDNDRFNTYKNVIKGQFSLNDIKLLDIHIGKDEIEGNDENTTISIDSNFHSGIDLSKEYKGIYDVVHDVNDEESEIKKRVLNINKTFLKIKDKAKKRPLLQKIKELHAPVTLGICVFCVLMYIITAILSRKYSIETVVIFLGAQYNTFTLGLHQVYRLLTNAFLHGSLMHLVFNLLAFYYVGIVLERSLKTKKYLILLFSGIIFSSVSSGILAENGITIGLSGAIYCLFVYFVLYFAYSGFFNIRQFMPTIILNLMLNFVPGVSWQSHLGGAVCGALFFFIYKEEKPAKNMIILICMVLLVMNIKYFVNPLIKPLYGGTDMKVVEMYKDLGLDGLANRTSEKLYEVYTKEAA